MLHQFRRLAERWERRTDIHHGFLALATSIVESFGTVGDCFDNAVMESFWGRMQTELLDTRRWPTPLELTTAMADYIDNVDRRHSYLGNSSPAAYEALWHDIQPSPQLS